MLQRYGQVMPQIGDYVICETYEIHDGESRPPAAYACCRRLPAAYACCLLAAGRLRLLAVPVRPQAASLLIKFMPR
jgi:hypothetical protein